MDSTSCPDAHWVLRCRSGNPAAFDSLVRRYQNAAYAVVLTYLRSSEDAQDIVQDAFITANCKLHQLIKPAAFGGWFRAIVVSLCREWLRSHQLHSRYVTPIDERQVEINAVASERLKREELNNDVWDAVGRLPEPYRHVVSLHYFSGFSYQEIARFLDLPVSTVRGRLQQARVRLKDTLTPLEQEELTMEGIDITKQVQETVLHIAKQDFRTVVPMGESRSIVLYCGIETDVEIRQSQSNEIVLEGVKMTLALSKQTADASLQRLVILSDQVDDFLATGPHRGESISGIRTSQDDKGTQTRTAEKSTLNDLLRLDLDLLKVWPGEVPYPAITDVYPSLTESIERASQLPDRVQAALRRVTRLSVAAERMDLVEIPRDHYSDEVKRIFSEQSADQYTVFGQSGYVSMIVSIPVGVTLTVFRGRQVHASGIHGTINTFMCGACKFSDIIGDLFLFKPAFRSIQQVQGCVDQRFFSCGGTFQTNDHVERTEPEASEIGAVTGSVDLDVLKETIRASDLNGSVRIINRYGTSALSQKRHEPGTRIRLESKSGAIRLTHPSALEDTLHVTVNTLCGKIQYGGAIRTGRPHAASYGSDFVALSTRYGAGVRSSDFWDVDVHLVTESGDITVESQDETEEKRDSVVYRTSGNR